MHRRSSNHGDLGQGKEVWARLVGSKDLLTSPLRQGDDGAAGAQGDPCRSGLAPHRPQPGVARQRGLGIDGDAATFLDGSDGGAVGVRCLARVAKDRDLSRGRQDLSHDRNLEDLDLAQEARHDAVVVEEVGHDQRVDIRVVVGGQDEAALPRQVLPTAPVAAHERHEQGPEDGDREEEGGRPLLAAGAS